MELGVLTHLAAGVEIRARHELSLYQRRLIAALGARYVIDPAAPVCAGPCQKKECGVANPVSNAEMDRRIAAMTGMPEAAAVTRCSFCPWKFEGTVERGRDAYANHRRAAHGGSQDGRSLLEQMDRGEPLPKEESMRGANGRRVWTREDSLAAVQAFAEREGRPPKVSDAQRKGGANRDLPSYEVAKRLFGSWPDLIEEAGFERPAKGRRQRTGPAEVNRREGRGEGSGQEPTGALRVGGATDSEEPERKAEIVPVPPSPPPMPVAADPEKVDIFDLFRNLATEERIVFYEEAALQAQIKANALRQIREALEVLDA